MAISELTDRMVAQFRSIEKKQADAADRAAAKAWNAIIGIVRREAATAQRENDDRDLWQSVAALDISADEAVEAISRISDFVDCELDLICDAAEPATFRTAEPMGHVRQRRDDLVRSYPHLRSGKTLEPHLTIDRALCDSICQHIAQASRLASAQRVIDVADRGGFIDSDKTQAATTALAALVRHCAAGGSLLDDERAGELTAAVASEYVPDVEDVVIRTLFIFELEEAATRDESDSSSWYHNVRPTLACGRLRELRLANPHLFAEPELATAAK